MKCINYEYKVIMKKYIIYVISLFAFVLSGCKEDVKTNVLTFATTADYPPFEYYKDGKITGFDIELAELIAKELGKEASFENMQFSGILPALTEGQVDAAISTISITYERKKNFDFSTAYYVEAMAAVFKDAYPVTDQAELAGKKIACQLGSTMEIWLKKHVPSAELVAIDNNNQSIEALKAGHVDVALMDGVQGVIFSKKNPGLNYAIIAKSDNGYGVAFKKGSSLKDEVNQAIKSLKSKGEISKLEKKWIEGAK